MSHVARVSKDTRATRQRDTWTVRDLITVTVRALIAVWPYVAAGGAGWALATHPGARARIATTARTLSRRRVAVEPTWQGTDGRLGHQPPYGYDDDLVEEEEY